VSAKVEALLDVEANGWTEREFLDLAIAALDQAGVSATTQRKVRALLPGVCDCDHLCDDDGVCRACVADIEQRCDDEINRQIDMRRGK
jgi:hypothetical protein